MLSFLVFATSQILFLAATIISCVSCEKVENCGISLKPFIKSGVKSTTSTAAFAIVESVPLIVDDSFGKNWYEVK